MDKAWSASVSVKEPGTGQGGQAGDDSAGIGSDRTGLGPSVCSNLSSQKSLYTLMSLSLGSFPVILGAQ